jgi:flagellar biosynthetic protein FliR
MMDPQNGVQVPVVAQLYILTSTLLFLAMNGHLLLLEILAQSFSTFPVAADGLGRSALEQIIGWGSRMFAGGLLIALPAVAVLLLANLGMGIITRAAPQLNIFAVGFPMTILIGFLMLWITLPNVMANFIELLEEAFYTLQQLLHIAR